MKHLKHFENSRFTEKIKVSKYDGLQQRALPTKRRLSEEENKFMLTNMSNYAWSNFIDANGHIGLGGGMSDNEEQEPTFRSYITEDDLLNAMVADRFERAKRRVCGSF